MGGAVTGVGIVGLGVISEQYLTTLLSAPAVRIVAVADLDAERARAVAAGLADCRALSPAQLFEDPDVEVVLNLTVPGAHAEIALAAISHGRAVYGEKPLAATFDEAKIVMDAAHAAGVRIGAAPDTVLGTGLQTARAAIDEGAIGRPTAAAAMWISPGHEAWHPHPDFYYRTGGGPLLDMGPYYVTALVQLLGPVAAVSGAASRSRDERVIASGPRRGESVPVEVDTHLTGILHHRSGAISTVTMSFDGVRSAASPIEVHGTEGSIVVPDPNGFAGEVRMHPRGGEWEVLEPSAGFQEAGRGVGLIDFAQGKQRADGAMALHVLEVMSAVSTSARSARRESLSTSVERPQLVPLTAADVWREPA